jgi:hypothetical protein
MSEIDRDSSIFRQGFMFAHLAALVPGHGEAHLGVKAFEDLGKGLRYGAGLPIRQLHQGDKESFPLDQSAHLRQVSQWPGISRSATARGLWSIKVMSGID